MERATLKMDAKAAMREAAVSPYVITVIMGIIVVILSVCDTFLGIWEDILENGSGNGEQMGTYLVVSIIFFIIYMILSTILQFGYQSYCLKVANRDNTMSYLDLFSSSRYFLKSLGLIIMIGVFTFLWTLLLIIPGIIASYRYSQAILIMVEDPSKGIFQCIRESKDMMVGNKFDFFVLELSFILWSLLAVVTCGLALIYVYPYMNVTFANFYNKVKPADIVYEDAMPE